MADPVGKFLASRSSECVNAHLICWQCVACTYPFALQRLVRRNANATWRFTVQTHEWCDYLVTVFSCCCDSDRSTRGLLYAIKHWWWVRLVISINVHCVWFTGNWDLRFMMHCCMHAGSSLEVCIGRIPISKAGDTVTLHLSVDGKLLWVMLSVPKLDGFQWVKVGP